MSFLVENVFQIIKNVVYFHYNKESIGYCIKTQENTTTISDDKFVITENYFPFATI